MTESRENLLTRRQLVTAACAVGVGTVAAGCAPTTQETSEDIAWAHEADILCVGGGAASLTAAVIAHGNGDQVIILERQASTGGTTAKSAGAHWIPGNFDLRERNIKDDAKDVLRFLARLGYPAHYMADHPTLGIPQDRYSLLSAFVDHAAPMVDRLLQLKAYRVAPWDPTKMGPPRATDETAEHAYAVDYLAHLPEDKVPYGRSLGPVRADGSLGAGADLVEQLETYLRNAQQPILLKHRVQGLIRNGKGEVTGLAVETGGNVINIRARKAVIFGTGGFAQNPDFRMKFLRERVYGACAAAGSQGDFISIASAAGAALGNMYSAWRADAVIEEAVANDGTLGQCLWVPPGDSMIFVNKHGDRSGDEHSDYNTRAKNYWTYESGAHEFTNQMRFMLFDQRTRELYAGAYPIPPVGAQSQAIITGETLPELAAKLRERLAQIADKIGPVALADDFTSRLEKSIARFNGFARSGKDADFGRGSRPFDEHYFRLAWRRRNAEVAEKHEYLSNLCMYPIAAKGPYYVVMLGLGVLDTNGGPVVNDKAQVVDYQNRPIKGLYAAGNCVATPLGGDCYAGPGGTIGPAMTFAYIAANAAHQESVKEAAS